jgi:hypothetical protein
MALSSLLYIINTVNRMQIFYILKKYCATSEEIRKSQSVKFTSQGSTEMDQFNTSFTASTWTINEVSDASLEETQYEERMKI